jgi:hypothetical protein
MRGDAADEAAAADGDEQLSMSGACRSNSSATVPWPSSVSA